jgi:hypothetical protein
MAQVVEYLSSKCKALSSNPSTTKKSFIERQLCLIFHILPKDIFAESSSYNRKYMTHI